MAKVESKKCGNCGGILKFDPNKQTLSCIYCQSEFPIDYEDSPKEADIEYCNHMHEYRCENCGASLLLDETTVSSTCVYCHSNITLIGQLSNDIKPDKIMPFAFDKEEAINIFLQNIKKMKFLPRNFFSSEQLDNIQGVYYPFWIVDADVDATAKFESTHTYSRMSGNYRYTTTSKYSHLRSGNIKLEDVSSCAIKNVDKNMLEGVFPFPFNKYKEFNSSYLVGFNTQKRDLEKSQLTKEIHGKIKKYSVSKLANTTATVPTLISYEHKINKEEWSYALLPIYVLTYNTNNTRYVFAINGHTKKIYGEYPISKLKVALVAILILLIAALLGVGGGLLW